MRTNELSHSRNKRLRRARAFDAERHFQYEKKKVKMPSGKELEELIDLAIGVRIPKLLKERYKKVRGVFL